MGFDFKMLDQLHKSLGHYQKASALGYRHKTSRTYTKSLGHCQKASALGYHRKTSDTQEEGETKRLINDNHQTFWSLYFFPNLD